MNKCPVVQGWLQQKGSVELDQFQGGAPVNRYPKTFAKKSLEVFGWLGGLKILQISRG